MDDPRYFIALNRISGLGGVSIRRLLEIHQSPRAIFEAGVASLCRCEGISADVARRIAAFPWKESKKEMDRELHSAQEAGARLVPFFDPEYPDILKQIHDPPPYFYLLGRLLPQDAQAVALVGSRSPTAYGKAAAERLGRDLSAAAFTVVSGMARGIDSIAHRAALDGGGRTLAVLGSGIGVPYPRENKKLMERIAASGAVLSEFPPDAPPESHHFPRRNRIISGLSLGVVVVEAAEESGSLITARLAAEQGREVFALPGPVTSPLSRGCHRLIQQGAKLIGGIGDILEEFSGRQLTIPQKRGIKKPSFSGGPDSEADMPDLPDLKTPELTTPELTTEEGLILACLSLEVPQHPDAVIAACRFPAQKVAAHLLTLEMKGAVQQEEGRYLRTSSL
jgi:DNA processing protein